MFVFDEFRYRRLAKRYAKGRKMVKNELGYDMPDFEEVIDYTEDELRGLYSEINDRLLNQRTEEKGYISCVKSYFGAYKGVEFAQIGGGKRLAVLFGEGKYDEELFQEIQEEFSEFYCIPYVLRCAQNIVFEE